MAAKKRKAPRKVDGRKGKRPVVGQAQDLDVQKENERRYLTDSLEKAKERLSSAQNEYLAEEALIRCLETQLT